MAIKGIKFVGGLTQGLPESRHLLNGRDGEDEYSNKSSINTKNDKNKSSP